MLAQITAPNISFDIYGPKEDPVYWDACEAAIKKLPANVSAQYKGSVAPHELENIYGQSHLMFLPSLNENFGHSIVESLLCGCPVLISDQTPWNDLSDYDAGFAFNLGKKEAFATCITTLAQLSEKDYTLRCEAAIKYISNKIKIPEIINDYKRLFNA